MASVVVSAAVEGTVDEAIVRRIIAVAGAEPGAVYGKAGKDYLRRKINGYNNAARHSPWIVLVDLDHDADCAPALCEEWLPTAAPRLCFRVAVREAESWLIADAEALAPFLSVARSRIPTDPESLPRPKRDMVRLAARSRRRAIREDMVPRKGSGRVVGPAYPSRLVEFVRNHWRPDVAAGRCESLRRAVACLRRVVAESI